MISTETLDLLEWHRLCQNLSTFAATKLGVVAASHLKLPTTQIESEKLLAQTKEIYNLEQELDSGWTFKGIHDVGGSLERVGIGGLLSAKELLDLATTLAGVRYLRRLIDRQREILPTLEELVSDIRTYPEIEQEIHHCIDDRGEITDRANPKLAGIRSEIKSLRERIYKTLQNIMQRNSTAIQEAVITQRSDRFVLSVKPAQKETIKGIVHDVSSTGSTYYIEPNAIVQLGNQLRQKERQEKREEEIILKALSEKVGEVQEDLERVLAVATILDLATARARYGLWLEANPPKFIDLDKEETITLRRLHHPLLVWQQRHESGMEVVPIDVLVKPETKVVAITGPNTGGKTVTLKTMGLAALMAKAGMFVPAKEPVEIPWFDVVLADIGDEQSLQQSLSTFSGHIRRISRIIAALQPENIRSSLVLLDEVGAGTDPAEGSALAIALLKHLAEHSLLTIATTHYGELKALKYQDERFENASVEFDDNTLQPTYRLLWGIPGRSNALTIAQRLGLDSKIVEEAQSLVGTGSSYDVNEVIAALEAQRREQEAKATEAGKLLEKTERFYSEVSAKASSLQEREQALKVFQEKAVTDAIADAKKEIAKVIRQLQQGDRTMQKTQQATEAIDRITAQELAKTQPPKTAKPGYKPHVGEKVRIPRLNQTGEVLSIDETTEQLTVRFGIMKINVGLTEIESLDGQKADVKPKAKATTKTTPAKSKKPGVMVRTSKNTLDIRGSRVNNAEMEIDNAIAHAIESGVLWIIHGKGTGRLREGVHEYLKSHSQVDKFELAEQKEGGSGVTVVHIK
ncbi:endonuclease MutS2 [Waterburya agarophytonicola K14]|uniref:Endonuclease MutS2 n=1 Tax=Waterburya agarophytonicola KI4 TaxID=2874699 RepID=A0A964BQL8_9CYAN|nr:endonuclease MutS2 [Waterburya agarophytonicola KI4]